MSAVITVTNTAELNAAMATLASGAGGTIRLQNTGAPYEILFNTDAGSNEPAIIITSDDPGNPAVVERIDVRFRENLTIDNVVVDSSGAERAGWINDIEISHTKNVTIQNSELRSTAEGRFTNEEGGKAAESLGTVRNSEGFSFTDNKVTGYFQGLTVLDSQDVTIVGNDISEMQGDGLRIAGIKGLLIEDNYIHDFYGSLNSLNHDDMIQIWGRNAGQITEDVIIRGNILDAGEGAATQGIFGRNEDFNGHDYYRNILIENNIIHNGSYNGISMSDAEGLVIRDNTVLWNADARSRQDLSSPEVSQVPFIRAGNAPDVEISGNIAVSIIAPEGTDLSANALFTYADSTAENYIGTHLVNAHVGAGGDLRDLMLRPDSPWVGQFGADLTQPQMFDGEVMAVMEVEGMVGHPDTFTFSAALSRDVVGYLDEEEADFVWSFSDGTTATGMIVTKTFDQLGDIAASLTVRTGSASSDTISRMVEVKDPALVEIDFDGGVADISGRGSIVSSYDPTPEPAPGGVTGDGFHLDGLSRVSITRDNYHIFNLDAFSMGLAIRLDAPGEHGAFLRLHNGFYGQIMDDGSVRFSATTSEGSFRVETAPGALTDTAWHKLWVTYDSAAEVMNIYLDGALMGQAAARGITDPRKSWGLDLGESWGTSVRATIDDFAFTREVLDADDIALDQRAVKMALNTHYSTGENVIVKGADEDDLIVIDSKTETQEFEARARGFDGDDEIIVRAGAGNIRGHDGNDTLILGAKGGKASGGGDDDFIKGAGGADTLRGNSGKDIVFGGSGADLVAGGLDDDLLSGEDGSDTVMGKAGNDTLYGGNGNDLLMGGRGHDLLSGNAGADRLIGGEGNDTLVGGNGTDIFAFEAFLPSGTDRIADFENGVDLIEITGASFSDLAIETIGQDVRIGLPGGGEVVLQDFDATQLDPSDFLFL